MKAALGSFRGAVFTKKREGGEREQRGRERGKEIGERREGGGREGRGQCFPYIDLFVAGRNNSKMTATNVLTGFYLTV